MSVQNDQAMAGAGRTIISVDAMGGDRGPAAVVAGISDSAVVNPEIGFILHGPKDELELLVAKRKPLAGRVEIRDATDVVTMDDKPSQVMRHGKKTSMWSALNAVRDGEADVCVSCGNTGALMALSMIRLRKLPGVNRPAIAILWPSRNPQGFNVMLDVGADIRADEQDLLQYALMGTSYARNGLNLDCPRIGLLNVGTEEHKGRAELKAAHDLIADAAPKAQFDFVGFVEGGDIPGDVCDVIVTDGFTGNIALKTGEGTASLIGDLMRQAFPVFVPVQDRGPFGHDLAQSFEKTYRSAPREWRSFPGSERHCCEVSWLGRRDRCFGRSQAGIPAVSVGLFRETCRAGCIRHRTG